MTVVLDSWPILRYLEGASPAADAVEGLLAERPPTMSWINLGEVAYVLRRRVGAGPARSTIEELRTLLRLELPSEAIVMTAADIKARHPMAYADAFAAATAQAHGAELWTGDPELMPPGSAWRWRDLRTA